MLQESILQNFPPSLSYNLSLRPLFCLLKIGFTVQELFNRDFISENNPQCIYFLIHNTIHGLITEETTLLMVKVLQKFPVKLSMKMGPINAVLPKTEPAKCYKNVFKMRQSIFQDIESLNNHINSLCIASLKF